MQTYKPWPILYIFNFKTLVGIDHRPEHKPMKCLERSKGEKSLSPWVRQSL